MPRVVTYLSRVCALALLAVLVFPAAAPAAGELTIVSSVRVEAPKGFYTGQPLRFSFTVRNQTASPVLAEAFDVPVRSPAFPGLAIDTVCLNAFNHTIPPGGTYVCDAPRDEGYAAAGDYTYWADWRAPGEVWHHGELGPDQVFSLTPPPQTALSTPTQVSVGEQGLGGARDTTLTVTNTGGAVLLIDRGPVFGGLNPADFALVGDSCTQAPVAAGASCNLIVRFTPAAAGPRAATLSLKANTSPAGTTISLNGAGVAPSQPVIVATPERLSPTLSYGFSRLGRKSSRFTTLSVKGVPRGATVQVSCSKGCARKAMTSARSGTVSLKPFVRRSLRVKTKITVRVTKPGTLGVIKTFTVRARKRPSITTTCLDLEGRGVSCAR